MATPEEIVELAREHSPRHIWFRNGADCTPDGDLLGAFDIIGDDADEFMMAFSERYDLPLDGFLSYFRYNANDPAMGETAWLYTPDGRKLGRIPLTPNILAEAVNRRKWHIEHPDHLVKGARKAKVPLVIAGVFAVIAVVLLMLM